METIIRKLAKEGTKEFKIYEQHEADDLKIPYKYWKECDAEDVGQIWALSDDGWVGELLMVKLYTPRHRRRPNKQVQTAFGRRFVSTKVKLDFLENLLYNSWNYQKAHSWQVAEANRLRTRNTVKVYVQMMLAGAIDWNRLGQAYRPDQYIAAATVRRLFKTEEVKAMVDKELSVVLSDKGADKTWLIEKRIKAVEIAEKGGNAKDMTVALDKFDHYLGLNDRIVKSVESEEFSWKQLSEGVEDERRIKIEKSTEKPLLEKNNDSIPNAELVDSGSGED
ncbi:MAG: hypothetical protein KKA84_12040 [Bacteroidetes bacterium]|nr:hypothetical protein [Bacteroidota bacterium]